MDGTTLVGWILATVGFAGIYGAFKNETWLSVMLAAVKPENQTRTIDATVTPAESAPATASGGAPSTAAVAAVAYAMAQRGKPYRWGATGPDAFDCSGLVYASYKAAGVSMPRTTYQQVLKGKSVSLSHVIAGDLVFPDPGHVMIALGGGQAVQAPHTGTVVQVTPLPSHPIAIRRVA